MKSAKDYENFCKRSGLLFKDTGLLVTALTHSSFANENRAAQEHNERLEFLGDSVLGLSVSKYLYHTYRQESEGFLAKIKSTVVSARVLADIARQLDLGPLLKLGKGELATGGRERESILADALEALIGAYFCDAGFSKAYAFIEGIFHDVIEQIVEGAIRYSYRTELQEIVQKHYKEPPEYRLLSEEGPSNERIFSMEVFINGEPFGRGTSTTKKEARQEAAKAALKKIRGRLKDLQ